MTRNISLGKWGEKQAEDYLEQKGVKIIGKNIRTRYGEIDLLGRLNDACIFIEVKTRSTKCFGMPEDAVTKVKLNHIYQSAQAYLQDHPEFGDDWRIDVVAIQVNNGNHLPSITWFENVSIE